MSKRCLFLTIDLRCLSWTQYILPQPGALQVFFVSLILLVAFAVSCGWWRFLQQQLEVSSLSGKLLVAYQARLEKLAEMLTSGQRYRSFSDGVLWNLIATVEGGRIEAVAQSEAMNSYHLSKHVF